MAVNKRQKILEAALEMFVNNGFESSPTSKIAKLAEVATGTLFHYFKTKEELINELYLEVKRDMVEYVCKGLEDARTIRQKIECIWTNSIEWGVTYPSKNKFFAMFGTSSYITSKTREEGIRNFNFVLEIIEQGVNEEIIKDLPIGLIMEASMGILNGSIHYFQLKPEDFNETSLRSEAFTIFWDSLKR